MAKKKAGTKKSAKKALKKPAKKAAKAAKRRPVAKKAAKKPAKKAVKKVAKKAAPKKAAPKAAKQPVAAKAKKAAPKKSPARVAIQPREVRGERDPQSGRERAFVETAIDVKDDLAEELGESFIQSATSGEGAGLDVQNEETDEEKGGPFVETTADQEFADDVDESNPEDAERAPLPTTAASEDDEE